MKIITGSTLKQTALAYEALRNSKRKKPLNKKQMLASVSYGKIQKQPSRIFEAKGTKNAFAALGLTEDLVTASLVEDIKEKPQNRLGELRLASEILNMKPDEKKAGNVYNVLVINAEQKENVARALDGFRRSIENN